MLVNVLGYKCRVCDKSCKESFKADRQCGMTYHSVEIWVDGDFVHKIPYAYGYDAQYEDSAKGWLAANGYLPGLDEQKEALWRYCERMGIRYHRSATDVTRKKDL